MVYSRPVTSPLLIIISTEVRYDFGYRNQNNQNITLKNNYFGAQGSNTLDIKWWQEVDVSGNRIWNDATKNVSLTYPNTHGSYHWDNNVYFTPDSKSS